MDKNQLKKQLSSTLENVRWGMEVSQLYVSGHTGIAQGNISAYESGSSLPSVCALIKLADCYDVSLDYLVGRCENRMAHKTQREIKFREM